MTPELDQLSLGTIGGKTVVAFFHVNSNRIATLSHQYADMTVAHRRYIIATKFIFY